MLTLLFILYKFSLFFETITQSDKKWMKYSFLKDENYMSVLAGILKFQQKKTNKKWLFTV